MEIRLPIFTHNYVLLCVSAVFVYASKLYLYFSEVFWYHDPWALAELYANLLASGNVIICDFTLIAHKLKP